MRRLDLGLGSFGPGRPEGAPPGERLAEQAELAERLGYDSVWVAESHFEPGGSQPAPLLLLAAMAARTRRIRLGTTSFLLSVRHPIRVAEDVAVLDQLSGGRVILGVGRGFRPSLFAAFGTAPAEKRDRFEATLQQVLRAWRGEAVAPGDDVPLRVTPGPLQRPHPPVWVAAFGPKALAQAGRLGLPYLASPIEPLEQLEANHARHRAALPPGRSAAGLPVPVIRSVFVAHQPGPLQRVREGLAAQARALAASGRPPLRRLAGGPVESFALVGEPGEVADGIERYRERIGLSCLIARAQLPGATPEEVERSIHLLAELVAERFRADP